MPLVFEPEWVKALEKRFGQQPEFYQPPLYRLATYPKWASEREVIERWVSLLSFDEQREVIARLRSPDLFIATRNELLVGDLLRQRGYQLEYEKSVGERTPDWYIHPQSDSREFVVEVATIFPPNHLQKEQRIWEELRLRIREIEHYFHLWMSSYKTSAIVGKDIKAIVRFVEEWLNTIDPQTVPDGASIIYSQGDLKIEFELLARKTNNRKPVEAAGPVFSLWVDIEVLRRTISKKLYKYRSAKEFDIPLVIALVPTFDSAQGIDTLLDGLFGREQISVVSGAVSRDRTGLLLPKVLPEEAVVQNTRLSAVFLLEASDNPTITVIHNPHAQNPISPEVFAGVRNLAAKGKDGIYFEMEWVVP